MKRADPMRWEKSIITQLADAGFALSRLVPPIGGGRIWESWAHRVMQASGAGAVQGPGTMQLFGYDSLSGLKHEIDAACVADVALAIEAKDQGQGVDKGEVDIFDGGTTDYFEAAIQAGWVMPLYRMIWSTAVVDQSVSRYAAKKGIIVVDPQRVPLPALLAATERWDAVDWFSDSQLSELVLLGEQACRPLTRTGSAREPAVASSVGLWTRRDLDDLEYLHDLASAQWLDWLDHFDPLHYSTIAERHLSTIAGWSELKHGQRAGHSSASWPSNVSIPETA